MNAPRIPSFGPTGLLAAVVAVLLLGSGGMIVASEIAARTGERSSFEFFSTSGERFGEVVTVRSDDNAGTSVAFSRLAFPREGSAQAVVIGRDDVFADNLAAGLLQGDGPLLLTDGRALNETVREEIVRLGARRATIVGGPRAVLPQVEQSLHAMGLAVTRLAGPTRVETALAIARHAAPQARQAVLVRARDAAGGDSSQAWADSLSAGAFAAAAGVPVLLTDSEALHPAVAAWISAVRPERVHAIGGTAAVGPEVLRQVNAAGAATTRISGAERTETAIRVAERLWGYRGSEAARDVVLVDGFAPDSWAAGVSAAAFAARFSAPLVLSRGGEVPPATEEWITRGGSRLVCGASVEDDACRQAAAAPPAEQPSATPTPRRPTSTPTPSATPSPVPTATTPPPLPPVSLTDSRAGQALFTLDDLWPGDSETRRLTVRNDGAVFLQVRLHGHVQGDLAQYLRMHVVEDPDGTARTLYDGALEGFGQHRDYATAVGSWHSAPQEERVYEFRVWLPQGTGAFDGPGKARATFVWEGRA